jgi:thiamine transporter ThiT
VHLPIHSILDQVHISVVHAVLLRFLYHFFLGNINFIAFEPVGGGLQDLAIGYHCPASL